VSAGDVLLFSRKTSRANFRRDPFGTVMCALIHLTTRSRYNHAALDIGDGLMVEATNRGVVVSPIESADEIHHIYALELESIFDKPQLCSGDGFCPITYLGNDKEEVLAWAAGRVGWKYGYGNAFWCGLRNLFPGLAHIKHGKTIICSELVADALQRAGHDWQKDPALVSPGDLAEHFGVPRR
jgi:uncharacterized protein YycO